MALDDRQVALLRVPHSPTTEPTASSRQKLEGFPGQDHLQLCLLGASRCQLAPAALAVGRKAQASRQKMHLVFAEHSCCHDLNNAILAVVSACFPFLVVILTIAFGTHHYHYCHCQ